MANNEDNQTFENVTIGEAETSANESSNREVVEALEKVTEAINEMREVMQEHLVALPMQIAEEIRNLADG